MGMAQKQYTVLKFEGKCFPQEKEVFEKKMF